MSTAFFFFFIEKGSLIFGYLTILLVLKAYIWLETHFLRTKKKVKVSMVSRRNKQIEAPSNDKINFIQIYT